MQKDNTRGNSPNGICVPCSPTPVQNTYYYCDPNDKTTCKSSDKCPSGINCYTELNTCNTKCGGGPLPPIKKLDGLRNVAYLEGWNIMGKGDGVLEYGNLTGYTHIVFAFAVPYHYFNGGCSGWCTPWAANDMGDTNRDYIKELVDAIKAKNPNIKVLLSFGGWGFSNFQWAGIDKKPYSYCNFECKPTDKTTDEPDGYQNKTDCTKLSPDDKIEPHDYCYGSKKDPNTTIEQTAQWVAQKLIKIVEYAGIDGIDVDMEDTCGFAEGANSGAFQFMIALTLELATYRNINRNFIITQAPMNAYLITDTSINKDSTDSKRCGGKVTPFATIAGYYIEVLQKISKYIDFISVQYYNGAPDSAKSADVKNVLSTYTNIATKVFGGDTSKVVIGMCTVPENAKPYTTCLSCYDQDGTGINSCWDGKDRANNIVAPLYKQLGSKFGGVMGWASLGDMKNPDWNPSNPDWKPDRTPSELGTFSNPMNDAMGKSSRR